MANALSIAAATLTLRNLLGAVASADYSALPADARPTNQIDVTTLPPDRARDTDSNRNRVNLFLYRTEFNPDWRNRDLPRQTRPGEVQPPLMPLDLEYLVTVFAENDNELIGQVLLGTAMRVLHDTPVLSRAQINAALALSELDTQIDRVRITEQSLGLDDLSKLWSGLQTELRTSAAYRVGVLLIESDRPARAALPVLSRGSGDRGPTVVASPAATLGKVQEIYDPALPQRPPSGKPAAELGDTVVLEGTNLGAQVLEAVLRHPRLDAAITWPLSPDITDTEASLTLPAATDAGVPAAWPPGFYTVELRGQTPPVWTTNRISVPLATTITSMAPSSQAEGAQPFALTLTATPQIRDGQPVQLILGARAIAPDSVTTPADPQADTTLVFTIDALDPGDHVVRLRVDGVDSIPIDFSAQPMTFDAGQTLTITP